jgi:hypothetical protein
MKSNLLIAALAIVLLSSCNSVKKSWLKLHRVTDSTAVESSEQSTGKTKEETRVVDTSRLQQSQTTQEESGDIVVQLDPITQGRPIISSYTDNGFNGVTGSTSSTKTFSLDGTITITTPEGQISVIVPGNAKSVTIKNKKTSTKTQTLEQKGKDSTHTSDIGTSKAKQTKAVAVHKSEKTDTGNKWVWRISLPLVLILIVAFYFWWMYLRKRKGSSE